MNWNKEKGRAQMVNKGYLVRITERWDYYLCNDTVNKPVYGLLSCGKHLHICTPA